MEMYQMMLQYKEVYTNMIFENIPTMPLELRAGIERTGHKKKDNQEQSNEDVDDDGLRDSAYNGVISDFIRKEKEICNDRQMRQPELLMLQSSAKSTISIDKITKFSVRPPELRYVFDKVGLH